MKSSLNVINILLLTGLTLSGALSPALYPGQADSASSGYRKGKILSGLDIKPLNFSSPDIQEKVLSSGPLLLQTSDNSLPMVTVGIVFEGGLNAERPENRGTLEATIALMKIGGAGDLNGEAMARKIARLGARLSFDAGYENWSVNLTVLKKNFNESFALLQDILLKPKLPADSLLTVQNSFRSGLAQRNDRPDSIARRKLIERLYKGYSRGYFIQKENINNLKVENLKAELARRLRKKDAIVVAGGDLDGLDIETKFNALFNAFPAPVGELKIERPTYQDLSQKNGKQAREILLVNFPAVQASILVSGYLPRRNHPDFYNLQVGNFVLGGGSFNSRLMKEIRVKRGLAYYAYSYNSFFMEDGRFIAASATRLSSVKQTLSLILENVHGIRNGVSEQELGLARDSILNALIFQFGNPSSILQNEVRFRRHGLGKNYLSLFGEKIRAVNNAGIRKTVSKYLDKEKMIIIVVGPASLKSELEKIRPVRVVNPEDIL